MTNILVTGGPGLVGRRALLRLLAAGREVYTMLGSPLRVAEARAMVEAGWLDAAAGGEYLDDRIRLTE